MKSKIAGGIIVMFLLLGLMQVTIHYTPVVFSDPSPGRKEIWRVVNVTNSQVFDTAVDIDVAVNSRKGVNIACSTNITDYFRNPASYSNWWDWLNGNTTVLYHWDKMDWSVSNGSLASITYNEIQQWGWMYLDSGGSVSYTTFMANTYMADWNLTDRNNDPDIVYQAYWQGNQIKMIDDFMVPNGTTINVVFKIVITEPGDYTFNVTGTSGVTVEPSSWTVGGVANLLVPTEYPTIQAAINASSSGDTIKVAAGTYNEALQIDKPLTVIGNGSATTFIDGTGKNAPVVKITANSGNVKFSGFTIRNAPQVGVNLVRMCIFTQSNLAGPTYTITDCKLYGSNNVGETEDYGFYMQGGKENIVFSRNYITQTASNPIVAELHTGATEISYNTLEAPVGVASDVIFFMTYDRVNVTTLQNVSYNTFDMGTGGPFDYAHRSAGVTFASPGAALGVGPQGNWTNMVISGNTFNNLENDRRAIGFWNNDNTLDNIISPQVTNNTINGVPGSTGSYGISIYGRTVNASITGNTINGTAVGIYLRSGDAPGTKIISNNIAGNTIGIDWASGSEAVDAHFNWWGNETGPTHATNPSGRGDSVTDKVVFEPWLVKAYPPLAPVCVVYVNPRLVTLESPASGKTFGVDVKVENVSLMYGFQFTLRWDSALLGLTSVIDRIPGDWLSKNYSIAYNETTQSYHTLGVTAYPPSSPFNGTAILSSLTFKAIYDPIYPQLNVNCSLALENVRIGDPTLPASKDIVCLVYNGNYTCFSVKPKLLFMSSPYSAKKVPTEFDAAVNVTSVVNLYAFNFTGTFDTTLLNVLSVDISSLGGTPDISRGWNNTIGYFYVNATGIDPAVNGSRVLATIRFKVMTGFVWNIETTNVSSRINFTSHRLARQPDVEIEHDAVNGTFVYRPVPGDINPLDGLVDIFDLITAAQSFGTTYTPPPYLPADFNHDGRIDILDIIVVARNFGRTEP